MSPATASARQKAPRRTAERILEAALELFNRYGEPNASTSMIAAELHISPGNLYYHYPAKEALVNALVDRFEQAMQQALTAAERIEHHAAAHEFLAALLELIWQYRFLYRDLNDLLTRNRQLEQRYGALLDLQQQTLARLLARLQQAGLLCPQAAAQHEELATLLLLVLTGWFSHEYVRQPRSALEPDNRQAAIGRAMQHLEALLQPWRLAAEAGDTAAAPG
ncbi:MAG: hypothetical protein RJA44_2554 [Pseudomonadota bacterium]